MIITDYKSVKRKEQIMLDYETNTPDWFVWHYVQLLRIRKVPFKGMEMRNKETKSTVVHIFMKGIYLQFYMVAGSHMLHVKKHVLSSIEKTQICKNRDILRMDEILLDDVECTKCDVKDKFYYFTDPYVYVSNAGQRYCPAIE